MGRPILDQLVLHEGIKLQPYRDTEGFWTILCGYNLSARGWLFIEQTLGRRVVPTDVTAGRPFGRVEGLTRDDALRVLAADVDRVEAAVKVHFPTYLALDPVRRRVVLDMAFNMGFRALGFKATIAAVKARDWSTAARELYKSKWAYQVGDGPGKKRDRCDRLAQMLLTGLEPTDVPPVI